MSYFTVNKKLDYERGFLVNGEYREGRLRPSGNGRSRCCFISRLFDSREEGTEWARFTADARKDAGAGLQIGFYASDTPAIPYEDRQQSIAELIRDPELTAHEKKRIFAPLLKKRFVGHTDILLSGIRGRYLFFILELYRQERENTCGDMCLYFPKESWMRFLPGVYSMDAESSDFTERYLGIFQSFYEDREREIRGSASLLNPASCSREMLEELAAWRDLKDIYLWPDDKLRLLIFRAAELSKQRGTQEGLREYLTLYMGEEPEITEDPEDGAHVTVAVPERYLLDMREYRSLRQVIGHMLPAGMEPKLVLLKKDASDESRAQMGVNTVLGGAGETGGEASYQAGLVLLDGRKAEK